MIAIDTQRPSVSRLVVTPALVCAGLIGLIVYLKVTPGRLLDGEVLTASFVVSRILRHLELVGISFALAACIGVAAGAAMAGRGQVAEGIAFLPANLGQAVPSIGVLALASQFVGLGITATVIALTVFGVLPVMRNTTSAINAVDADVVEAAVGSGMTKWQVMTTIKLPMASVGIFAGLRTSLVLIVGTATLGNFIGGGGLGDVINAGLGNLSVHVIVTGAALVAALALTLDWALGLIERVVTPHSFAQKGDLA